MDFFEAQDKARRRTSKLVILYVMAVLLMIAAIYLVVTGVFGYIMEVPPGATLPERLWHPELLLWVSTAVVIIILAGTLFRVAQLRRGGASVAEMLGGRKLNPTTSDPGEKQLVNVVEEISIASGIPVPDIYILDNESSINAFAAGYGVNDAAVGVTRGCIDQLSRDELQGVIAHEFSHIFNGDMRLNIRLIGILNGILLLHLMGMIVLRGGAWSSMSRGVSGRGKGGNAMPIIILGLSLIIIGYIGMMFGRIIQSAVSRQREFLADAAAVQYTRNPSGLAGALRKIAAATDGSRVRDGHSDELSHLFFARSTKSALDSLFSTHPPIEKRIKAIDPAQDGEAIRLKNRIQKRLEKSRVSRAETSDGEKDTGIGMLSGFQPEMLLAVIGTLEGGQLKNAENLLKKIPEALREAVHDPLDAEAMVYWLLLKGQPDLPDDPPDWLREEAGDEVVDQMKRLLPVLQDVRREWYLALVDMAMPALRNMSPEQYRAFRSSVERLANADKQISLFEFALEKMLIRRLDLVFSDRREEPIRHYHFKTLTHEVTVLLSALAHASGKDPKSAWEAGVQHLGKAAPEMKLLPPEMCSLKQIDNALAEMACSANPVKEYFLAGAIHCIHADQKITREEAELLRAMAEALDCPLPLI